jgi:hypothetical protein
MNPKGLLLAVLLVLVLIGIPLFTGSPLSSAAAPAEPQGNIVAAKPPTPTPEDEAARPTKTSRPTKTPLPTATFTETPWPTETPEPTQTPTETPVPTDGPSPTPTETATPLPSPVTSGSIYWGVSMSGIPAADMSPLTSWEQNVAGKPVSIVHWGHFWSWGPWPQSSANQARAHGSIPMISWTPEGGNPKAWQLIDIVNGSHDAYIRQFAADAKDWGFPFFLRIMHEMNGSWGYPWQETQNGNNRGEYVLAWRHIIDIFRAVGVTNASYVWCPNIDYPNTSNPSFASLYPGDDYVDWTCLDGYNWGTNRSSGWQSFDTVFNYSYNEVLKLAPAKPMMLGEYGSVEQGGSKADWFADALNDQIPGNYGRVRAIVYYNRAADGVDWRIETSSSSGESWRAGIASAYYAPNSFGSLTGTIPVP